MKPYISQGTVFNWKVTEETLWDILHINGKFGSVRRGLRARVINDAMEGIRPITDKPLTLENGRTVIDIAWRAGFSKVYLPDLDFIESLKNRGAFYGMEVIVERNVRGKDHGD